MTNKHTDPGCVKAATEAMGDKWTPRLLGVLAERESMTFSEMSKLFAHMSPRTLSQRIDSMEDSGLITRRAYQQRPTRYLYVMTEKGYDLVEVLKAMAEWGQKYAPGCPCSVHNAPSK